MALYSLYYADVPLRNCSLTQVDANYCADCMSVSLDRRELDLAVQALDKDKFVATSIVSFFTFLSAVRN